VDAKEIRKRWRQTFLDSKGPDRLFAKGRKIVPEFSGLEETSDLIATRAKGPCRFDSGPGHTPLNLLIFEIKPSDGGT